MHGRLLGPCFKTGRMETDLLAPLLGATLYSTHIDAAQATALIHHGDEKEQSSGSEECTQTSNQQNSVKRTLTNRYTRKRSNL